MMIWGYQQIRNGFSPKVGKNSQASIMPQFAFFTLVWRSLSLALCWHAKIYNDGGLFGLKQFKRARFKVEARLA